LLGEIRGLALQLRGEGPASQVLAQMLERAAQQPPGEWLYSVGGKPVLVMWGHAAPGATVPGPEAPVPVPTVAAAPANLAPSVPPPVPPLITTGKPWKRWLLWGLLALLLLALLLWGLRRCSESPQADAGLDEQIAQAEARNQALEEELARKRVQAPQMQCVPDAPPRAAPAPEPPASAPEPPAAAPPPPASQPAIAKPAPPAASVAPAPAPKPPPAPASQPEAPRAAASAPPAASRQACKSRQPGDEPEVVMIVDASASMRQPFGSSPSRLDAAKRAAEAMIRALPSDVDVGLVDFGACGQVRRDKFYPAAQRGALLAPKQGTPLADAIKRAGTVASDSATSVLVIVSDGGDSCGGDACAMARSLKAGKPNVIINVIDLSDSPRDRQVLQCIASAGGGRLLSPADPADMNRKMKEAAGAANCPP
jgi:Mg-chelatase subunit ChlD